jgi:hypothetical protein
VRTGLLSGTHQAKALQVTKYGPDTHCTFLRSWKALRRRRRAGARRVLIEADVIGSGSEMDSAWSLKVCDVFGSVRSGGTARAEQRVQGQRWPQPVRPEC